MSQQAFSAVPNPDRSSETATPDGPQPHEFTVDDVDGTSFDRVEMDSGDGFTLGHGATQPDGMAAAESGLIAPDDPHWHHRASRTLTDEEFDMAVAEALDQIPEELTDQIDNCVILVEDNPPPDSPELLGLYEGTPLTERDGWWAAGALPDRITIYREPLRRLTGSADELIGQIAVTVIHEIAHHFGLDDDQLEELGWA